MSKLGFQFSLVALTASFVGHQASHWISARQESSAEPRLINTAIDGFGPVVSFPNAAEQPQDAAKICVDLTAGAEPNELNGGLRKVARFVNIYRQAGAQPVRCQIIVVIHGSATSIGLESAAYRELFDGVDNPNLGLIKDLHDAGVRFVVCGQSMNAKDYPTDRLVPQVELAVSALSANVNRQAAGYAMIPLP